MPYDYWLWRAYRKPGHASWGELTGEIPHPAWRTYQDLWYLSIEAEVEPIARDMAQRSAANKAGQRPPQRGY